MKICQRKIYVTKLTGNKIYCLSYVMSNGGTILKFELSRKWPQPVSMKS
jgi:hypothetical protein